MKPGMRIRLLAALVAVVQLSACGGSSSGTASTTTVSGSAVAGAVTGTLRVTDADGAEIATGTITDGDFSVALPDSALGGELDFDVLGTYTDEVSGAAVNLTAANALGLRLAADAVTAGADAVIGITPETTVVRELVRTHQMTLTEAGTTYQAAFGNTPDGLSRPFDPSAAVPAWADADTSAADAAFRVGAYSQWGNDLGLSGDDLAALPGAIAHDLADGDLDGHDGTNPVSAGSIDLQALHQQSPLAARYLGAMASFAGSDHNVAQVDAPSDGLPMSGVTDSMSNMAAAQRSVTLTDGTVLNVSVKVNNTDPFPTMGPATARTVHRVTITDDATGAPVDITAGGAVISAITPAVTMHMLSGMHHSTPMADTYNASSVPASGIYDFDVYYVMASSMGMGDSAMPMGLWDFKLAFTDETGTGTPSAVFHPDVTMPMDGSVLSSKGSDATDMVMGHGGTESPRSYWAWLDAVTANGADHDVTLFISTKVGMMFPAVFAGASHSSGMDMLDVASVTVELSTDGTSWTAAAADGSGRFTATIAGLSATSANDLWVKLTVNGNVIQTSAPANLMLTFTAP